MMDEDDVHKIVSDRLAECRNEVDGRINSVHSDMSLIRTEMNILRSDVHRITVSTDKMSESLEMIASSIERLTDLPETWAKVKGFWSVLSWLRGNWFLFAILGACIFGALWLLGIKVALQ